jgi:hypothetical protein
MMAIDAHIAKWQTIQLSIVGQRAWKRKALNKRSAPDSFLFFLFIDDCLLTHGFSTAIDFMPGSLSLDQLMFLLDLWGIYYYLIPDISSIVNSGRTKSYRSQDSDAATRTT